MIHARNFVNTNYSCVILQTRIDLFFLLFSHKPQKLLFIQMRIPSQLFFFCKEFLSLFYQLSCAFRIDRSMKKTRKLETRLFLENSRKRLENSTEVFWDNSVIAHIILVIHQEKVTITTLIPSRLHFLDGVKKSIYYVAYRTTSIITE